MLRFRLLLANGTVADWPVEDTILQGVGILRDIDDLEFVLQSADVNVSGRVGPLLVRVDTYSLVKASCIRCVLLSTFSYFLFEARVFAEGELRSVICWPFAFLLQTFSQ